jgi:hypothetical protein
MQLPPKEDDTVSIFELKTLQAFVARDNACDQVFMQLSTKWGEWWFRTDKENFITLAREISDSAATLKGN